MIRVAILGSGFGLYGYLPAILNGCGKQVVLPERYRQRLETRSDVGSFVDRVEWAPDELSALDRADAVVISQRPIDQMERVRDCIKRESIRAVLLEKPLAPDPLRARQVLQELEVAQKRFRIGYTFRHTGWGVALLKWSGLCRAKGTLSINWTFRAAHYAGIPTNWKRYVSAGGGSLRFYGIHLIALLAEMGYSDAAISVVAADSSDEAEKWRAVIVGSGLPDCHLRLDSRAESDRFSVNVDGDDLPGPHIELTEPFQQAAVNDAGLDRRVDVLTHLCQDLFSCGEVCHAWYSSSIALWSSVEERTRFVPCAQFNS